MNLLLLPCLACALVFGIAGQRGFKRPERTTAMQWAILLLLAAFLTRGLYLIVLNPSSLWLQSLGSVFCLGGLLMFVWARKQHRDETPGRAYTEDAPKTLVTTGPYARVRHPIYTAYLVGMLGLVVGAGDLFLGVGWVLAWACYGIAAMREEALILSSEHGEAYRAYMNRSGRLIPWNQGRQVEG